MADSFANSADAVSAPATRVAAVAPHDTNALGDIPKALYVGTGGTLVLRGVGGGADVTLRNVPSGALLPIRAAYIRATGTSAADLVALY